MELGAGSDDPFGRETLTYWRLTARVMAALAQVWIDVSNEFPVTPTSWPGLLTWPYEGKNAALDLSPIGHLVLTAAKNSAAAHAPADFVVELEASVREGRPPRLLTGMRSDPAERYTRMFERLLAEQYLQELTEAFRVRLTFKARPAPRLPIRAEGLFGTLVLQLILVAAGSRGLAICSGCSRAYPLGAALPPVASNSVSIAALARLTAVARRVSGLGTAPSPTLIVR
jgi:hypothetical protein